MIKVLSTRFLLPFLNLFPNPKLQGLLLSLYCNNSSYRQTRPYKLFSHLILHISLCILLTQISTTHSILPCMESLLSCECLDSYILRKSHHPDFILIYLSLASLFFGSTNDYSLPASTGWLSLGQLRGKRLSAISWLVEPLATMAKTSCSR